MASFHPAMYGALNDVFGQTVENATGSAIRGTTPLHCRVTIQKQRIPTILPWMN